MDIEDLTYANTDSWNMFLTNESSWMSIALKQTFPKLQ